MPRVRCSWCNSDPLSITYHDEEWGVPCHEPLQLFEMLNLEGAQAGLSWITVLKKRSSYRSAFDGFDPRIIGRYDEAKVEELLKNPGIIRNRLKVRAVIANAQAYLAMEEQGLDFSRHLWSFVEGRPLISDWTEEGQRPSSTPRSDAMAKDLKKHGFRFVGTTICYAFMQATGMVDDHSPNCWKRSL